LFRRTLAVLMILALMTLPLFLPINTASAQLPVIPNPHQYRYATIGQPDSLDPGWAYDTFSGELIMNVCEPLIAYDHESTSAFVPVLAKSLPKIEKVTETLTSTTVVDKTNPVGSDWVSGGFIYHLFGWQDKDDSWDLTVGDVVWFENLYNHEYSFHGVVKNIIGDLTLEVERVRIYFEINTDAVFHPWTSDIPGYEAHTADHLETEDVEFTFERSFVLDHMGGPMGLIMMPTMGIMTTREFNLTDPAQATMVGHMIDTAFAHDDTHFWFNLVQTFPPFLQIITQSWGMIMNKDWIIALQNLYNPPAERWQGWGSPPDYDNWLGYTNPEKPDEVDDGPGHMCGTGPYKFDYLIKYDRWQISKFDGYWGGWLAEGRSEDLYLDRVISLYYEDPTLAFYRFLSNWTEDQCDSVYVPKKYIPELKGKPGVRMITDSPDFWALIICGSRDGSFPMDSAYMYHILKEHYAFDDDHIYYLHVYGGDPVDGLSTKANVTWAITHWLQERSDFNDVIFIYFTSHGGGYQTRPVAGYPPGLYDGRYDKSGDEGLEHFEGTIGMDANGDGDKNDEVGFDESIELQDGLYWDDELKRDLNTLRYGTLIMVRQGCFGGGIIDDISAPNRIIMTATNETARSWGGPVYSCWSEQFMNALHGEKVNGEKVDADTNHDDHVSMKEAWDYAWNNDPARPVLETPWLDDDGNKRPTYINEADQLDPDDGALAAYQWFSNGCRLERDWVQGWYPASPYGYGPGGYFYHMWKAWCCHGDLDFRKDTVNGAPSLNYLTCDYKDLFKFRGYYLMPKYIMGHRMRYADYDCDKDVDYLDLFRFRNYYINYPQWSLCPGPCRWHWPPPPH